MRHFLNESISFPTLNCFNFCYTHRHIKEADFLEYSTIMDIINIPEVWMQEKQRLKYFVMSPPQKTTFMGLFDELGAKKKQSLSEIYSLLTFRKEFDSLPPLNSKKIKVSALEGLQLASSDISGLKSSSEEANSQSLIDSQGVLINNSEQNSEMISHVLSGTVQKGYFDSLVNIDVDKFIIEEYRESVIGLLEFYNQIGEELKQ